jgi:hypothetical protein
LVSIVGFLEKDGNQSVFPLFDDSTLRGASASDVDEVD